MYHSSCCMVILEVRAVPFNLLLSTQMINQDSQLSNASVSSTGSDKDLEVHWHCISCIEYFKFTS